MSNFKYNTTESWGVIHTTIAAGTAFTQLEDVICDEVTIFVPSSGAALQAVASNENDLTKYVDLEAPSGTTIFVGGSAQEIGIRTASAIAGTCRAIWRKYKR